MEQKDYFVRHPKQIVNYLTQLQKQRCSLLVTLDNQQTFITAIIEIDPKNNLFIFDCLRSEKDNQQLLNSTKVLFRTEVDGIKVSFKGVKIRKNSDKSVFTMPIPDNLYWLQRRELYRIRVPMSHNCYLELVLNSSGENQALDTYCKKFRLIDLSVDGFAFLNVDRNLQEHFAEDIENLENKIVQGAIILREYEDIQSDIEFVIKHIQKVGTVGQYRVGCQFTEISSMIQSSFQRYMQRVELDAKAKE